MRCHGWNSREKKLLNGEKKPFFFSVGVVSLDARTFISSRLDFSDIKQPSAQYRHSNESRLRENYLQLAYFPYERSAVTHSAYVEPESFSHF